MQQVQASIVSLVHFKLHLRYLMFSLCFCTVKPLAGDCLLESQEGAISRVEEGQKEGGQLGVLAKQGQARADCPRWAEGKSGSY